MHFNDARPGAKKLFNAAEASIKTGPHLKRWRRGRSNLEEG